MGSDSVPYPSSSNTYIPPPAINPQASHVHAVASSQPRIDNEPQRRKRPKYTRSKTGCLTCRIKKIKCDETRPICMRCTHGQRDCVWPESVPVRKKATPRKNSVDGRSSTAESSAPSETSTPSTRDNTPPRRLQGEYSLPRHSEPFLGPDPELSRRQLALHPHQLDHPSQTNVLSMIPEMPAYKSARYDSAYSDIMPLYTGSLPKYPCGSTTHKSMYGKGRDSGVTVSADSPMLGYVHPQETRRSDPLETLFAQTIHSLPDPASGAAFKMPSTLNSEKGPGWSDPAYNSLACDRSTIVSEQCRPGTSTLPIEFPPPLDLTPHIVKIDDRHFAGGGFGDVYKCWYINSLVPKKVQVAVKAFRFKFTLDRDGDKSSKMVRRELDIWRRLDHSNVVPFLGIAYGFGMHGAMSLVSLWMSNDTLHNFLTRHDDNVGVVHRLQLLQDIANGLQYLHSFSIVHGDLNPNNVLLDADYTARLSDFGYASLVGNIPEALAHLRRSTTRPGALRWAAPEQIYLEDTLTRTTKSDIYSFGCLALQVLSGQQPWSEVREDAAVILHLVMRHKPGRPESRPVDDLHWDLIDRCWSSMEERPTAEMIISSIEQFLSLYPSPQPLRDIMGTTDNSLTPDHIADSCE